VANSGFPLVALDEYVHPAGSTLRCQHALLDAGAFETCTTGMVEAATRASFGITAIAPALIEVVGGTGKEELSIMDMRGRLLGRHRLTADRMQLPCPTGVHTWTIRDAEGAVWSGKVFVP
jgi:hypothetical protein